MSREVLISVAPNGARKMRADHPALPLSPEEIAQVAHECATSGAGLLHLHVREADGRHSLDAGRYREAMAAVRERVGVDLIIQITTEAVGVYGVDDQLAVVRALRPEACSIALREVCPSHSASEHERYSAFLAECRAEGVWVQHILYDEADIRHFHALNRRGAFGERPFVLLVIGRYAPGGQSDPRDFTRLLGALDSEPANAPNWAVCAFGAAETRIVSAAAALDGHIRVGFENNLLRADGSQASSNAERVADIATILGKLGLAPMSAATARQSMRG